MDANTASETAFSVFLIHNIDQSLFVLFIIRSIRNLWKDFLDVQESLS